MTWFHVIQRFALLTSTEKAPGMDAARPRGAMAKKMEKGS